MAMRGEEACRDRDGRCGDSLRLRFNGADMRRSSHWEEGEETERAQGRSECPSPWLPAWVEAQIEARVEVAMRDVRRTDLAGPGLAVDRHLQERLAEEVQAMAETQERLHTTMEHVCMELASVKTSETSLAAVEQTMSTLVAGVEQVQCAVRQKDSSGDSLIHPLLKELQEECREQAVKHNATMADVRRLAAESSRHEGSLAEMHRLHGESIARQRGYHEEFVSLREDLAQMWEDIHEVLASRESQARASSEGGTHRQPDADFAVEAAATEDRLHTLFSVWRADLEQTLQQRLTDRFAEMERRFLAGASQFVMTEAERAGSSWPCDAKSLGIRVQHLETLFDKWRCEMEEKLVALQRRLAAEMRLELRSDSCRDSAMVSALEKHVFLLEQRLDGHIEEIAEECAKSKNTGSMMLRVPTSASTLLVSTTLSDTDEPTSPRMWSARRRRRSRWQDPRRWARKTRSGTLRGSA